MTYATVFLCVMAFCVLLAVLFLVASIRIIPENKRLQVYRLGRYLGEKGPGVVLLIPIIDRAIRVEAGSPVHPAPGDQIDEQGNVRPR